MGFPRFRYSRDFDLVVRETMTDCIWRLRWLHRDSKMM